MLLKRFLSVLALLSFVSTVHATSLRTVEDVYGKKVTIPNSPQRIITLSEIDLDIALALGVTPVGTVNGRGQQSLPRYLESAIGGDIEIVGDLNRPNLEKILELEPDLILTTPNRPEVIELLGEIAPTIVTFQRGEPWKETFDRTAQILNRQQAAKDFMAQYQSAAQQAKQAIGDKLGQTISVVRWNPKGPAYMFRDSFASQVIDDLGMKRPDYQQDPGHTHSLSLSLEALELLDGDWMVVGTLSTIGEAVDAMKQAEATPAFQQLSAIQSGRYAAVDGSLWTSVGGPLAALKVMEDIVQLVSQPGAEPLVKN
ncbi:iron-siderophore ABC transporter substrate-binding protein [Photobacterium rosenbergii]|uniref:Iron-siderophore ABC transporter substrate-binding protein n=1 Tax=Photobacterium rosenbergii TaxID=294936 RepID=A0ABU3ZML2_9GAMM|nr:iron-siderophore ABC transporter substrate-binding protein [Photobacterium rosenbergii]MDV5171356.1 iron-siderophore ABC transporter substrate-binding protein [Photobacterium rosenbergii]